MKDIHRQVVEALEGALLLTDARGHVVFVNDSSSRLLGRDLTGVQFATDQFEDDPPLLESLASVYREATADAGAERKLIAATDETGSRFYLVTVSRAPNGALPDGWLIAVDEIGASLMDAPAIRRVFSQVSHDLRSPLTSISGAAELLLSGRVGVLEPVQRRLVTIVEQGARKIEEILAKTKTELARAESVGGEACE